MDHLVPIPWAMVAMANLVYFSTISSTLFASDPLSAPEVADLVDNSAVGRHGYANTIANDDTGHFLDHLLAGNHDNVFIITNAAPPAPSDHYMGAADREKFGSVQTDNLAVVPFRYRGPCDHYGGVDLVAIHGGGLDYGGAGVLVDIAA